MVFLISILLCIILIQKSIIIYNLSKIVEGILNLLKKFDWNDNDEGKNDDKEKDTRKSAHDSLDWNFKFKDLNAKLNVVVKEIESLALAVDIDYILASPWRVKKLAKNILYLSKYIDWNKWKILRMSRWRRIHDLIS